MNSATKQIFEICLLAFCSFTISTLIMHFGLTYSGFGLFSVMIAALTGGSLSACLVSRICTKNSSYSSWHILLAGTMTAFLPVFFIVCAISLHDELPHDSFLNKILERYDDKISPLHE